MIVVHAGAGYHSEAKADVYKKTCDDACQRAVSLLRNGRSSVEAVQAAISVLEDAECTNAGYGSNLTLDGKVECDASIMDGTTCHYGAVGALPANIRNPITAAHRLLQAQVGGKLSLGRVPPCTLVGDGARQWCINEDIAVCEPDSMVTESSRRAYVKHRRKLLPDASNMSNSGATERKIRKPEKLCCLDDSDDESDVQDTVGAVCVDVNGNIAAGVSSGGIMLKHPGRIGQAAMYGCGCWAQKRNDTFPAVGVSTSGCGEHLIKTMFAKECGEAMRCAASASFGISHAFKEKFIGSEFLSSTEAQLGGVVAVQCDEGDGEMMAEVVWAHTTETMCVGFMRVDEEKPLSILSRQDKDKASFLMEGRSFRWQASTS